jgi:hypothetical protein
MLRLSELRKLCSSALVQSVQVLDRWYIRLAAVIGFVLALVSTVINMVLVPIVNYQMVPGWQHTASQVAQRQVSGCLIWGFAAAMSTRLVFFHPLPLRSAAKENSSCIVQICGGYFVVEFGTLFILIRAIK